MDKFKQAKQIASGLTNYLRMKANISNSDIEEMQNKRFSVCFQCEFRNTVKNTCNSCGCALDLKTRAPGASCPEKFWSEVTKNK